MKPPALATWLLTRLISDEALVGDVIEQYQSRGSAFWLWRQIVLTIVVALKRQPALAIGAVALGWVFLWAFFWFIAPPLSLLDDAFVRLFTAGFIEPYSFWWWCRATVMWVVVAFPFFASGWLVARLASAAPIPVALAFAMSVSVTIAVALLLDGPFNTDLRMWLTVPLFLMVAPSTVILIGGLFGTRQAKM